MKAIALTISLSSLVGIGMLIFYVYMFLKKDDRKN
jgi:hypothetical protein